MQSSVASTSSSDSSSIEISQNRGRVASGYRPFFRRDPAPPVPVSNEAAPLVPSPQERVKNARNEQEIQQAKLTLNRDVPNIFPGNTAQGGAAGGGAAGGGEKRARSPSTSSGRPKKIVKDAKTSPVKRDLQSTAQLQLCYNDY